MMMLSQFRVGLSTVLSVAKLSSSSSHVSTIALLVRGGSYLRRCPQLQQHPTVPQRLYSDTAPSDEIEVLSVKDCQFIHGFADVPELHDAPEEVKRIFSLDNANKREKRKVVTGKIDKKFRHEYLLKKVGDLTLKIKSVEEHMTLSNNCRKDKHNKVFLNWLIDQRKKQLKKLRDQKFELYLDILNELDIPPLESPHTRWNKYKFRQFKIGVDIKPKRTFKDDKVIS